VGARTRGKATHAPIAGRPMAGRGGDQAGGWARKRPGWLCGVQAWAHQEPDQRRHDSGRGFSLHPRFLEARRRPEQLLPYLERRHAISV
jgi:hypothetical protein